MNFPEKLKKLGECERLARKLGGGIASGNAWMFKERKVFGGDTGFRHALRSVGAADAVIDELTRLIEMRESVPRDLGKNGVK